MYLFCCNPRFSPFLVGQIEGDGNFNFNVKGHIKRMTLTAKDTPQNKAMFEYIKKETGWGIFLISDKKTNPTLRYVISTKGQLLDLFKVFDLYPPITNNTRYRLARQKAWMLDKILEPEFKYTAYSPTAQSLVDLPYFDAWLVGFIEAEGSFNFTSGRPWFSLSQNNDRFQLEAIVLRQGISAKIYANPRGTIFYI